MYNFDNITRYTQFIEKHNTKIPTIQTNESAITFLNDYSYTSVKLYYFIFMALELIILLLSVLLTIAFYNLIERQVIGSMQRRRGPNVVGFFGLLQPIADFAKLLLKETIIPTNASRIIFLLAPILVFVLGFVGWFIIPFGYESVSIDLPIGLLFFFGISSLGVYGIIMAGWSSNSRYAFLGALRSAAQMISYEVSIGFIISTVVLCSGSLNFTDIVIAQQQGWYVIPLFPACIIFFIASLAETSRHPFDLPEAESELVSGYNVEYASIGFALFFVGEYSKILLMSAVTALFFFGGWLAPFEFLSFIPGYIWFALKIVIISLFFIWVRAAFPRYRYDQLMRLGWKVFLPVAMGFYILCAYIIIYFDCLPHLYYNSTYYYF